MTNSLLLDLKEADYAAWKHHPVTAAFLQFLGDQADNWRLAAMDMWENGRLDKDDPDTGRNANVLLGRVQALRELRDATLADIQAFYSQQSDDRS